LKIFSEIAKKLRIRHVYWSPRDLSDHAARPLPPTWDH